MFKGNFKFLGLSSRTTNEGKTYYTINTYAKGKPYSKSLPENLVSKLLGVKEMDNIEIEIEMAIGQKGEYSKIVDVTVTGK